MWPAPSPNSQPFLSSPSPAAVVAAPAAAPLLAALCISLTGRPAWKYSNRKLSVRRLFSSLVSSSLFSCPLVSPALTLRYCSSPCSASVFDGAIGFRTRASCPQSQISLPLSLCCASRFLGSDTEDSRELYLRPAQSKDGRQGSGGLRRTGRVESPRAAGAGGESLPLFMHAHKLMDLLLWTLSAIFPIIHISKY
ncbi:hypothetical protein Mapa_016879 [Marchantia paleacea]|nr:hypothetical protein Mapa_016879 [Marchantia paleacea]